LLRLVVEMLLDSADVVLDSNSVGELRRIIKDLRLELGLEILARHINPLVLVQVYAILRRAVPNYNHLALAIADVETVTTNQDVLIENAAIRLGVSSDVLHLHGRCDRPASVITLISQYVAGLPRATVRRLREKIRARHVLVLGYSGRDRDVMDVLEQSEVAYIQWVQHPGSTISPELQRLQNALGERMAVEPGFAHAKLADLLKHDQENEVRRALPSFTRRAAVPSEVRRQFALVPSLPRNLGLAAILRHASLYREAERVYTALGRTSRRPPVGLLLALASARSHQQNFDEGLKMFSRVVAAPGASALERSLGFLGQVEILRNSSRGSAAVWKLEQLATVAAKVAVPRERSRIFGRAAAQTGGIARVDGKLSEAVAAYSTAIRFFSRSRDLNEQLESKCWRADVFRMQGHYTHGHATIAAVLQESMLYVRHRVRAWAHLVSADIDMARGEMLTSAHSLAFAAEHFRITRNPQALVWTDLLLAAHRRIQGKLRQARVALDHASRQLAAASIPRHLAQARLSLEYAELARNEGDYGRVAIDIRTLKKLLRRSKHFSSKPTYLYLHALLIETECERDLGRNAADDLSRIGSEYEKLGFDGCASRARVAAWLSSGDLRRPRELLRACRAHGRQHELARLERRVHGRYPICFA
jgi:tetratricopeptide (TPR) repeat protein